METAILLVSHSELADGMKKAAEFIAGEQEDFYALGLLEDGLAVFRQKMQGTLAEIAEKNRNIIILCDIPSGSPAATSTEFSMNFPRKVRVLTGMNLPLVLELLLMREAKPFDVFVKDALRSAKNSVQLLKLQGLKETVDEEF